MEHGVGVLRPLLMPRSVRVTDRAGNVSDVSSTTFSVSD